MEEVIKVEDCGEKIGDYSIPIHNAIIVPENATNGDMIKAMFPDAEIKEIRGKLSDELLAYRMLLSGRIQDYLPEWWDEPYKPESEDEK